MKKYILAMDEGTTSARAILFDKNARIVAMAQQEFLQIYPKTGWVEQDPMDIYASQYASTTECIAKSGIDPNEIAGIGITNQRETTILWDKNTGKPVYNAIVWQCRRTADICEKLKNEGYEDYIRDTTGLRIDPYFSGTKIKWILDNVKGVRAKAERGEILFGTVDTWLIWKLTHGKVFVTDRTNASRTMMLNIHTGEWDKKMLEILSIPECMLPKVCSSSEVYGTVEFMGEEIPVSAIAGDQQSALFGQGCFEMGDAKNTYGTGCFLLAHTGNHVVKSKHNLLTTISATENGRPLEYALEGSVFVGGAIVKWLRDEMHFINDSSDSEYFASKVKSSEGVYVVPAFNGLGAPYWNTTARGMITGLSNGTGVNHIIRSALESICYQTEDVLSAIKGDMKDIKGSDDNTIKVLRTDGGASANNLLMQMQSDFSQIKVERMDTTEATAMGVAFLAGLAVGFFKDREQIKSLTKIRDSFQPKIDKDKRNKLVNGWHRAVKACMCFSEGE